MIKSYEPPDYTSNHKFFFDDRHWRVDESLLYEFNQLYVDLRETGCSGISNRLLLIVDQVFGSFSNQASDALETAFVDELWSEVKMIISDHSRIYSSDRSNFVLTERGTRLLSTKSFTGILSETVREQLNSILCKQLAELRRRAADGAIDRESLNINSGKNVRSAIRALNKEFDVAGVLGDLRCITRHRTRVVGLSLELSVEGSNWWKAEKNEFAPPKTVYAHVDKDVAAPKAIVYLSDVCMDNGPTSVYPDIYSRINISPLQDLVGRCISSIGSHEDSVLYAAYRDGARRQSSTAFRKHFMKLPPNVRFNSHFGWDVLPGSPLEKIMLDQEQPLIGVAGTYIIFDGASLLHRGGLIELGERVALQVVFGRSNIFIFFKRCYSFIFRKYL